MRSFIHFCISEINFTSLHIWTFQSFLTFVNALNGPLKITIKYIKIMAHLKKIFLKLFCNKLLFTWIGMCCYVEKCQMGWSVYDTMNRSNWKSYLDLPNFGKCSLETTSILLFSYIYLKIIRILYCIRYTNPPKWLNLVFKCLCKDNKFNRIFLRS